MSKRESVLLSAVIIFWVMVTAYISLNRSYFGFGTETDFLGGFIDEAQRLLLGEPLSLAFHPPFYAGVLALFQFFLDDWFLSGRVISLVSYSLSLISSFFFFRLLCGNAAGWGALLALITSSVFTYCATLATTDVFFYALYSCTLWVALIAYRTNSLRYWAICGVMISIVMLSRSNGFTLLSLVLLPWIACAQLQNKVRMSFALIAGVLFPLLLWAGIANYRNSPFMPEGNYINLALTYFPPGTDRLGGDARIVVESQFHSLWQVLAHDPMHMLTTYLIDLKTLIKNLLFSEKLVSFPMYLFLIPGVILLLRKFDRVVYFYLLIITLSQLLLINLKFFEARYYIFLVPLYGVALVVCLEKLLTIVKINILPNIENASKTVILAMLLMAIPAFLTTKYVCQESEWADLALNESIVRTAGKLPDNSWIVSRKPHMAFYNSGKAVFFPNVETYSELLAVLAKLPESAPVYVYYGDMEKITRPQFEELISGNSDQASWLTPIMLSREPNQWALYEFTRPKLVR